MATSYYVIVWDKIGSAKGTLISTQQTVPNLPAKLCHAIASHIHAIVYPHAEVGAPQSYATEHTAVASEHVICKYDYTVHICSTITSSCCPLQREDHLSQALQHTQQPVRHVFCHHPGRHLHSSSDSLCDTPSDTIMHYTRLLNFRGFRVSGFGRCDLYLRLHVHVYVYVYVHVYVHVYVYLCIFVCMYAEASSGCLCMLGDCTRPKMLRAICIVLATTPIIPHRTVYPQSCCFDMQYVLVT